MLRIVAGLLALLISSTAFGQGTVLQGGGWTSGRAPMYVGSGSGQATVQDSGPAGGGTTGLGLKELLLTARGTGTPPFMAQGTGPLGTNLCDYDAPTSNPTGYHYLCFSPNAQGGGLIAYGAGGAAANLPLQLSLNGTLYPFPFVVPGGGVIGPSTTTIGHLAVWNNTIGTLLADVAPGDLSTSPSPVAVIGLLGRSINSAAPLDGQQYAYSAQNGDWEAQGFSPTPNKFVLRQTLTKIANMTLSAPSQIRVAIVGDSVAAFHALPFIDKLAATFGDMSRGYPLGGWVGTYGCAGGVDVAGGVPYCGTINSSSGSVTTVTGDFTYSPTGGYYLLGAGGCIVTGTGGGTAYGDKLSQLYVAEPGAGSLELYSNKNGAGYVLRATVSASNVSTIGAVQSFTMGDTGPYTIKSCATGAAVKVFVVGSEDTTHSGVVQIPLAAGGITLQQFNTPSSAITGPWYAFLAPDLFTFEMKETSTGYLAALTTFAATMKTANPLVDGILIGSYPVASGDADQVLQNNILRSFAVSNNWYYWDAYYPALNYSTELAYNWINIIDGVHQTTIGQSAEANLLWQMTGLGGVIGAKVGAPVVSASVRTNALTIGQSSIGQPTSFDVYCGASQTPCLATINSLIGGSGIVELDLVSGDGCCGAFVTNKIVATGAGLFLDQTAGGKLVTLGGVDAAAPQNMKLSGQKSRAGTDTNTAGATVTVTSGLGTGTATPSTLVLASPVAVASGSGAQTQTAGLTIIQGTAQMVGYAVGSLPPCSATLKGSKAYATDANATTFNSTVAAGGANIVPVFCNGTNWVIG